MGTLVITKVAKKYECSICGSPLYRTDGGGSSIILQCSSEDAKFWNFGRGSKEQAVSHKHFLESVVTVEKSKFESDN